MVKMRLEKERTYILFLNQEFCSIFFKVYFNYRELKFLFNELDYCIVCPLNYIVEG